MPLTLRLPTPGDEARARELDAAFADEDFSFLAGSDGGVAWVDFLATIEREHLGVDLPPDRVRADFLLAVVGDGQDETIVGRSSVRYALTDYLLNYGGHIGYAVAREHRRKGYATEILRQSLALAAENGIGSALLTCDDDNTGSIGVIEACGGVLEDRRPQQDGQVTRRYWIDTATQRAK